MFLINKLWLDNMENWNAYGYKPIGFVNTKEEAIRISKLKQIPKSKHPWPLKYAFEFEGDTVPLYTFQELPNLQGIKE